MPSAIGFEGASGMFNPAVAPSHAEAPGRIGMRLIAACSTAGCGLWSRDAAFHTLRPLSLPTGHARFGPLARGLQADARPAAAGKGSRGLRAPQLDGVYRLASKTE